MLAYRVVALPLRTDAPETGVTKSSPGGGETAEGLSPIVAVVTIAGLVAHISRNPNPDAGHFSAMTSAALIAVGVQRLLRAHWRAPAAAGRVRDELDSVALVYVLLGASSLSFHVDPAMDSPAHTLDIVLAWVLVLHLAYSCAVVYAVGSFSGPDARRWLHVMFALAVTGALIVVVVLRPEVYTTQLAFYVSNAGVIGLCGLACRFRLARTAGELNARGIVAALAEAVVVAVLAVAGGFAHGELFGVQYARDTDPAHYDFYHGHWHLLLATATAIVFLRVDQAARETLGRDVQLARSPLDVIGLALCVLYASIVAIAKETGWALDTAAIVLTALFGLLMFHAAATLIVAIPSTGCKS